MPHSDRKTINKKNPRPKPRFTLVELLVVISFIEVLIALLLPSLASARVRARSVLDMTNLKHLFISIGMYGGDFQQLVPGGLGTRPTMPVTTRSPPSAKTAAIPFLTGAIAYTGGSILWTDKGHTQQMLGEYIDTLQQGMDVSKHSSQ